MKFHGIDLHTDSLLSGCLFFKDEKMNISTSKYYLHGDSFQKFKNSLSNEDYVLIESCINAFWLYDQLKPLVKDCFILNTIKFKQTTNKTDKIDVTKLAKKLAYYVIAGGDEGDLPQVYVPEIQIRELRGLFSTYKLNKKTINQYKNRIHSILKQNGIASERKKIFTKIFRNKIDELPIRSVWKFQIRKLFDLIDSLEENTNIIKQSIFKLGYSLFKNEVELLLTIPGFSPLTAIALMSDIANLNRFKSVKKFCAYLRTTPKVKGSNNSTQIGNTNKEARSLTCSLLTQSILHFINSGDYFNNFYTRIKVGKKAGVYRMAIIRKILVSTYYMLKRKKVFYWNDNDLYMRKLKDLEKELKIFTATENCKYLDLKEAA